MTRARRALRYLWTVLAALFSQRWRTLLLDGWRLERQLPRLVDTYPLPKLMEHLTPQEAPEVEPRERERDRITAIADAAVAFDTRAKLGLCLRRSLVRYHLLRQAGVPVTICFAARKHAGTVLIPAKITGHAWLVLHGIPYAEDHQHYRDFTVMFSYPEVRQLKLLVD